MRIRHAVKAASTSAAAATWCMASCSAYMMIRSGAHARPLPSTRCAFATLNSGLPFSRSSSTPTNPKRSALRRHQSGLPTNNLHSSHDDEDWDDPTPPPLAPPGAPSNSQIESTTLTWIRRSVIGLNLCPFAERPIKTKQLSTHVVRGDDHACIAEAVTTELLNKRDEIGTALVIAPEYYPGDFERYMSMIQFLEQRVMAYHELHGHVQIAPFHPQFTFDGSGENVDNYTNRSPYPMFHVLRKDEVSRAVAKLDGDPGKVWRRNVRLFENLEKRLGRLGVVKMLLGRGKEDEGESNDADTTEVVEEVLKQTSVEMEEMGPGEKNIIRGAWRR